MARGLANILYKRMLGSIVGPVDLKGELRGKNDREQEKWKKNGKQLEVYKEEELKQQ